MRGLNRRGFSEKNRYVKSRTGTCPAPTQGRVYTPLYRLDYLGWIKVKPTYLGVLGQEITAPPPALGSPPHYTASFPVRIRPPVSD